MIMNLSERVSINIWNENITLEFNFSIPKNVFHMIFHSEYVPVYEVLIQVTVVNKVSISYIFYKV